MEEKIKGICEEVLNVKLNGISDLAEQDVDSLDLINILFKFENDLGIKISNEDITSQSLTNMNNFVKYLQTNIIK